MQKRKPLIIYGPSGVGKTSVTEILRNEFKLKTLDTDTIKIIQIVNERNRESLERENFAEQLIVKNTNHYEKTYQYIIDSKFEKEKKVREIETASYLYANEGVNIKVLRDVCGLREWIDVIDAGFDILCYQNPVFKTESIKLLKQFQAISLLPSNNIEDSIKIIRGRHNSKFSEEDQNRQRVNNFYLSNGHYPNTKKKNIIYTKDMRPMEIARRIMEINMLTCK